MNGICLLILGIVIGVLAQEWRLKGRERQGRGPGTPQSSTLAPVEAKTIATAPQTAVNLGQGDRSPADAHPDDAPTGTDSELWLAYCLALERAQFQGGFLARTAHELRSPLSSLMGLLQLILTDLCDSPEEERQCVDQAYEAAQKLNRLMDQLIRVSRLEQGSQRLDPQPVDLTVLIEDVQSLVQLQVADRNACLTLDLPPQSVYAQVDYKSLRQMLAMLIESALAEQATDIRLTLPSAKGGETLQLLLIDDRPSPPWQESTEQRHAGVPVLPAPNQAVPGQLPGQLLTQLKSQIARGESIAPHRLSPGLVLLTSQLVAALNGGSFARGDLPPSAPPSTPPSAPPECSATELAPWERKAPLTTALEIRLPKAPLPASPFAPSTSISSGI